MRSAYQLLVERIPIGGLPIRLRFVEAPLYRVPGLRGMICWGERVILRRSGRGLHNQAQNGPENTLTRLLRGACLPDGLSGLAGGSRGATRRSCASWTRSASPAAFAALAGVGRRPHPTGSSHSEGVDDLRARPRRGPTLRARGLRQQVGRNVRRRTAGMATPNSCSRRSTSSSKTRRPRHTGPHHSRRGHPHALSSHWAGYSGTARRNAPGAGTVAERDFREPHGRHGVADQAGHHLVGNRPEADHPDSSSPGTSWMNRSVPVCLTVSSLNAAMSPCEPYVRQLPGSQTMSSL